MKIWKMFLELLSHLGHLILLVFMLGPAGVVMMILLVMVGVIGGVIIDSLFHNTWVTLVSGVLSAFLFLELYYQLKVA
jgi:hypothetical protein